MDFDDPRERRELHGTSNTQLESKPESTNEERGILPENDETVDVKPTAPPDGGTQAWLQVLGSWMLFL